MKAIRRHAQVGRCRHTFINTRPERSKREPWQGQKNPPNQSVCGADLELFASGAQPRCVHEPSTTRYSGLMERVLVDRELGLLLDDRGIRIAQLIGDLSPRRSSISSAAAQHEHQPYRATRRAPSRLAPVSPAAPQQAHPEPGLWHWVSATLGMASAAMTRPAAAGYRCCDGQEMSSIAIKDVFISSFGTPISRPAGQSASKQTWVRHWLYLKAGRFIALV